MPIRLSPPKLVRFHPLRVVENGSKADQVVPSFEKRAEFDVGVSFTYDHEVAATRYFSSLRDGEVSLTFHFNGTTYYECVERGLQVAPIPWDRHATYALPVAIWRRMMDHHYPNGAWVRLDRGTIERLRRLRTDRGLPSMDAGVVSLLDQADGVTADASAGESP